ncbi:MAG: hypothetical protein NTX04_01255 [Verrucomicrobia bacterium]|nr:hypothetical protein [Verrucomicrobiota bacterium]
MGERKGVVLTAGKARVEYAGVVSQVLDRGDRREAIFGDDADSRRFLGMLGEVCQRTGWRVLACIFMTNAGDARGQSGGGDAGEGRLGGRASRMAVEAQRDHGMNGARRLSEAGLICRELRREDCAGLKKGDERKAAMAAWIRAHSAGLDVWIAQELPLGHPQSRE